MRTLHDKKKITYSIVNRKKIIFHYGRRKNCTIPQIASKSYKKVFENGCARGTKKNN